jgi:hypothetical protein
MIALLNLRGRVNMRSSKIVHRWPAAAAIGLVLCGVNTSRAAEPDSGGLDVVQVRPNFYMIAGAGGNIAVQFGVDGVVLVDAGSGGASATSSTPARTRIMWAATGSWPKPG